MIYFDNAATTKPLEKVLEIFKEKSLELYSNPSSPHNFASQSNKDYEIAKQSILRSLNLSDEVYNLVFTSGATEANNLFLLGFLPLKNPNISTSICYSAYEHPSITEVIKTLPPNIKTYQLRGNPSCSIDLDEIQLQIKNGVSLICSMAVSNETGSILPLKEIRNLIDNSNKDIVLFSDITQLVGKLDYDYSILDAMTFSFHKFNGIKGLGCLIFKKTLQVRNILFGGGQQNNLRSGTLNSPLFYANAYALKQAQTNIKTNQDKVEEVFNFLVISLLQIDNIKLTLDYTNLNTTHYVLNFILLKHKASVVVEELSRRKIYVSTTSACSSHKLAYSEVLLNMGLSINEASNSIRLSFSKDNIIEEAKEFINNLKEILEILKQVK